VAVNKADENWNCTKWGGSHCVTLLSIFCMVLRSWESFLPHFFLGTEKTPVHADSHMSPLGLGSVCDYVIRCLYTVDGATSSLIAYQDLYSMRN